MIALTLSGTIWYIYIMKYKWHKNAVTGMLLFILVFCSFCHWEAEDNDCQHCPVLCNGCCAMMVENEETQLSFAVYPAWIADHKIHKLVLLDKIDHPPRA